MSAIVDNKGASQVWPGSITQESLAPNIAGNGPAFRVYQGASTWIGTTDTLVLFNVVVRDTASCFNVSNGRFKPSVAGDYQLNWTVGGDANSVILNSNVRKNGVIAAPSSRIPVAGPYPQVSGSVLIYLDGTTDYVDLAASGSAACNTNPAGYITQFSGFLARAA